MIDGWTSEESEIDSLYRQAVDAMEAVEWEHGPPVEDGSGEPETQEEGAGSDPSVAAPYAEPCDDVNTSSTMHERRETTPGDSFSFDSGPRVRPEQVLEAALFVGGASLTAARIGSLLGDRFETESVERMIDELNALYAAESRPYEVRLGESGYRLALRSEFEDLQNRVFGLGPKEVRLSQDVLEVLAVVAYRQPITRAAAAAISKRKVAGALRQLVRRKLILGEKTVPDDDSKPETVYRTTPRFLEVFGVARLEDLPRIEALPFK